LSSLFLFFLSPSLSRSLSRARVSAFSECGGKVDGGSLGALALPPPRSPEEAKNRQEAQFARRSERNCKKKKHLSSAHIGKRGQFFIDKAGRFDFFFFLILILILIFASSTLT
jgi:hypothetical protein